MKYKVTIDVPSLDAGVAFYAEVFGLAEIARPFAVFALLASGEVRLGIMEKPEGSQPAPGTEDRRHYARHWTPVHMDIEVDDFDATLERLAAAGGVCEQRFEMDGYPTAFCADPWGNGFCLLQTRA
ncbi:MAG: VOC family protein [Alphaproteobacteria bacterium]|nr:VOC family protein [Alphaproteobacteria bacterium]